jgi:centrosomal CEP192-like protein
MSGWFSRTLTLLLATAGAAVAQFPFQLLVTSPSSAVAVANDSGIPFTTAVGTSVTYHVTATYLPTNTANTVTISQQPVILGNLQFTISNFPSPLPVTLSPSGTLQFDINYKPTSANAATAQLQVNFTETTPGTTGPVTNTNAIVFILQGSSPSFILSYVLQSNLNVVPLASGGTIPFGGVQVNTTALAQLNISNGGSGPGAVTGITPPPAGSPFKVTGIPLLPAAVNAGLTLALTIAYTPTASEVDNAQIQITLDSGATLTVVLQGNGIAAAFSYQILSGTTPTPVMPPGPIALPDTNVGSTSSIAILVQNIGNANGVIANPPSVSGQGYTVSGGPVFPQTLTPSASFQFTINFAPTQAGVSKGNLIVGSDLFNLTGNGLGPQLTFSYTSAATGSIAVANGGTVVFSPIQVTQSEQLTFVITNSGTQTAHVSNIGIGEANSPFSVSGLTLPITLAPAASTQFTVAFAPTATSFSNGTLRIDTVVINLTGSGTQPPPLPGYTIQGPSGNAAPQTQPAVGLTLASGYPVALTGTLTLTTNGNFGSDPTVQFVTGGTTVAFTIPANSTSANFAGHGSQILLQTGTVAETIILTPDFQTENGGISLTPSPVTTLQFSVPSAAPTLLAITATGATTTGFVLNVTGFSTIRSVDTLTVQFTAAAGFNFGANAQVSVDLHSSSAAWYESTASQAFGGQFEVSIPFTFTGTNLPTGTTAIQSIASVAATVSNDVGTSGSLAVSLQ